MKIRCTLIVLIALLSTTFCHAQEPDAIQLLKYVTAADSAGLVAYAKTINCTTYSNLFTAAFSINSNGYGTPVDTSNIKTYQLLPNNGAAYSITIGVLPIKGKAVALQSAAVNSESRYLVKRMLDALLVDGFAEVTSPRSGYKAYRKPGNITITVYTKGEKLIEITRG